MGLRTLLERFVSDRHQSEYQQDRTYQRLEEAWKDWQAHGRQETQLLNRRELVAALEHLAERPVPVWLLEYFFCSAVAHRETQQLTVRGQLITWVRNLNVDQRREL